MAIKTKSIKKLNVQNFLTFLSDANTKGAQHILEIKNNNIYSKILPIGSKEYIKYAKAPLEFIGGNWSDFTDQPYRFYLTDLTKIIQAFEIASNYNKETVDIKVNVLPMDGEGFARIEQLWIEGQMKLRVSAKDGSFSFNYVADDRWEAMLASPDLAEFDFDSDDIESLKKIFNYLTAEDNKQQKEQGLHYKFVKNGSKEIVRLMEEDEKAFTLDHDKNVVFKNIPENAHFSHHAYIIKLLTDKLYRMKIKAFGEVFILVAEPTGDSTKIIVIALTTPI